MAEREGVFKRGNVWHVRTDPIERRQRSTGQRTKKDALRWVAERAAEAERIAKDPAYRAAQASFVEWCERFLARCEERGVSPATVSMYAQKLGHWVRILGTDARMYDVTKANVDRYISQRRAERVSPHTIHKECSILVRMLKVAKRAEVWHGDLDTLIPEDITPQYAPRERALKLWETKALIESVKSPRLAAGVAVCAALGVRRSEAAKLTRDDVDLQRGVVRVRGTKTKKSDREVPILSTFRPLLEAALELMPIGVPNNLYRDLAVACRRAGIEYCTPNDLRRSHASILLELEVDPDTIRRLLGHTSEAMLRRVYGRLDADALRAKAERAIRRTFVASPGADQLSSSCESVVSARNCVGRLTKTTEYDSPTRLPKPKVASSNLAGGAGFVVSRGRLSRDCRVPPRLLLASVAHDLGILPEAHQ